MDISQQEKQILKYWKRNKTFQKSLEKTKGGRPFVFFEGPPTANARPRIHHVLARAFKDIILRYQAMKGRYVLRKAGWDTHGLPVEIEIEKKLGLKNKQEIENYGIAKFNEEAKKSVWTYQKEWEKLTERMGFWINTKDPYVTYKKDYIETLWWIIKEIWKKGLLYKGFKVVPFCARCGTPLSSHELAQGYKETTDVSVYVKYASSSDKDTYFLVWTTTPWTLPANVALAVNPKINYVKAEYEGKYYILAESAWEKIMPEAKVVKHYRGRELVGSGYEPLFNFMKSDKPAYRVVAGDFVGEEEGTGIVHIAPAFGEDDMEVAKKKDLPVLQTVNEDGTFKKEIKPWAGQFVKDADPAIIAELDKKGALFKTESHNHDYPYCWRCDTPLIYYAKDSWFVKMSEMRRQLLENNKKINWIPAHLKKGRFGEWLKEVKDWTFSRERYWGTPLPVWTCQAGNSKQGCGNVVVIGSVEELHKLSGKKPKDLHRPYVDDIVIKCEECGGWMRRVPEVVDVWFDSGAMPFAQWHYPFENRDYLECLSGRSCYFPADYISEGIDQTRGWFYTLLAVSTLLGYGAPYKNVIAMNLLLDSRGKKMSKSRGNTIDPWKIADKYSMDALRWYFFTVNNPGEVKRFKEEEVKERLKKFLFTFSNARSFFNIHQEGLSKKDLSKIKKLPFDLSLLDKWALSRFHSLAKEMDKLLSDFDVVKAARLMDSFILNDLSNWYIRLSRDRFRDPKEKFQALAALRYLLQESAKLAAPFIPFLSEKIHLELNGSSVHLADYPKASSRFIKKNIEGKMKESQEIVRAALKLREEARIKVRQPLSCLTIKNTLPRTYLSLIARAVNVKEVKIKSSQGEQVVLDTKITSELEEEGMARDLLRAIQIIRKDAGLKPGDRIEVRWRAKRRNKKRMIRIMNQIKDSILAEQVNEGTKAKEAFDAEKEIQVGGDNVWLGIKKI